MKQPSVKEHECDRSVLGDHDFLEIDRHVDITAPLEQLNIVMTKMVPAIMLNSSSASTSDRMIVS